MRRTPGSPGRQPLPESVVSELLGAGLSHSTVLAMESWKAQEVLDLLHSAHPGDGHHWVPEFRRRGSGHPRLPGPASSPAGPVGGFSTQD
ncbi:MAG: hypothetical protein ACLQGJ_12830 [Candidatus Dormibacteria bacterium]